MFTMPLKQQIDQVTQTQPAVTRDDLSADQATVFDSVISWLSAPNRKQVLTVGGYAGTGKTTVTAALAQEVLEAGLNIAFCAFTGRAASVLGRKLRELQLNPEEYTCTTIHGLIYTPNVDPKTGAVSDWIRVEGLTCDLIVVDEASMIAKPIWDDLCSYGIPILAVGDHGQLAPIGDNPGLMIRPNLRLEKIHRQAEGNPILALAAHVRNGGSPHRFKPTDGRVRFLDNFIDTAPQMDKNHVGICFTNSTRVLMNHVVREAKGLTDPLIKEDILICLKNARPICNGMRGTLVEFSKLDKQNRFQAVVDFPDEQLRMHGHLNYGQFGRAKTFQTLQDVPKGKYWSWGEVGLLFDHGYVLTCHKMQGSQSREVTVMVENWLGKTDDDRRRWLYTAVTRASDQLNLVFE